MKEYYIPAYTPNKVWSIDKRVAKLMNNLVERLERECERRDREEQRERERLMKLKQQSEKRKERAEKRRAYKREWERKMRALKAFQRNDTDWYMDDDGNMTRTVGE